MTATRDPERQEVKLSEATTYLLDECRMVLPGIQATFGFQLVAVFNERFSQDLGTLEQRLHVLSLTLVALAAAVIMMPAAYHRLAGVTHVSRRFIEVSSRWMLLSMCALAAGLSIDYYVITMLVFGNSLVAIAAAALLGVLTWLWFVEPRRQAMVDRASGPASRS
jgi:hypothetical protein